MRMASEDRRRQLPWVALGLTVTLTAAIIFALWASSLSNRTAVAVASRDIPTGSSIEIDDLRAVELASGQGAGFVPMTDLEAVVGHTVRAAIPEGRFFTLVCCQRVRRLTRAWLWLVPCSTPASTRFLASAPANRLAW